MFASVTAGCQWPAAGLCSKSFSGSGDATFFQCEYDSMRDVRLLHQDAVGEKRERVCRCPFFVFFFNPRSINMNAKRACRFVTLGSQELGWFAFIVRKYIEKYQEYSVLVKLCNRLPVDAPFALSRIAAKCFGNRMSVLSQVKKGKPEFLNLDLLSFSFFFGLGLGATIEHHVQHHTCAAKCGVT